MPPSRRSCLSDHLQMPRWVDNGPNSLANIVLSVVGLRFTCHRFAHIFYLPSGRRDHRRRAAADDDMTKLLGCITLAQHSQKS